MILGTIISHKSNAMRIALETLRIRLTFFSLLRYLNLSLLPAMRSVSLKNCAPSKIRMGSAFVTPRRKLNQNSQ